MIKVVLTANLQKYYPKREFTIEASDLSQLLQKMDQERAGFSAYVLEDNRQIRKHVNFFVNGTMIEKDKIKTPLKSGDTVHIMQALSGG